MENKKKAWNQFVLDIKGEANFGKFNERFRKDRKYVLDTMNVSSKVLFKLFDSSLKNNRISMKNKLIFVLNKVLGLLMTSISSVYLKCFNEKYFKRRRLHDI